MYILLSLPLLSYFEYIAARSQSVFCRRHTERIQHSMIPLLWPEVHVIILCEKKELSPSFFLTLSVTLIT